MRYLHRTHRISVGWLNEIFQGPDMGLVYEATTRMCADIYTKGFTDPVKWEHAQWLVNVVNPALLESRMVKARTDMANEDDARLLRLAKLNPESALVAGSIPLTGGLDLGDP